MMRCSVRVRTALGVAVLSIVPVLAVAQVVPGSPNARGEQPRRGFRDVTFNTPNASPAPVWTARPFDGQFRLPVEGAPLPVITVAPQKDRNAAHPPCVIRVIPIDPRTAPRMLIMPGGESVDPKMVIKLPPCQPRR